MLIFSWYLKKMASLNLYESKVGKKIQKREVFIKTEENAQ
jgi:hypothetical protein